jgi:hypothetical protein
MRTKKVTSKKGVNLQPKNSVADTLPEERPEFNETQ